MNEEPKKSMHVWRHRIIDFIKWYFVDVLFVIYTFSSIILAMIASGDSKKSFLHSLTVLAFNRSFKVLELAFTVEFCIMIVGYFSKKQSLVRRYIYLTMLIGTLPTAFIMKYFNLY